MAKPSGECMMSAVLFVTNGGLFEPDGSVPVVFLRGCSVFEGGFCQQAFHGTTWTLLEHG